jgi:hypothetical protein
MVTTITGVVTVLAWLLYAILCDSPLQKSVRAVAGRRFRSTESDWLTGLTVRRPPSSGRTAYYFLAQQPPLVVADVTVHTNYALSLSPLSPSATASAMF